LAEYARPSINYLRGKLSERRLAEYEAATNSRGVQEVQGLQHVQGVQGLQHVRGLQGVQEVNGLQHVQGLQGLQHVKGVQHGVLSL